MPSEFGVEEEETIFKRGKAPSEAMSGQLTYATAAAILYAGLAAGVKTPPSIVGEIYNAVIFQTQSMLLQASRRVFS